MAIIVIHNCHLTLCVLYDTIIIVITKLMEQTTIQVTKETRQELNILKAKKGYRTHDDLQRYFLEREAQEEQSL